MAHIIPDIQKLEEAADYNRQRRTETAKALVDAAEKLVALEDQVEAARKVYETTYGAAITDAWTVSELEKSGFVTPDRYRPRPAPPRKRARTKASTAK